MVVTTTINNVARDALIETGLTGKSGANVVGQGAPQPVSRAGLSVIVAGGTREIFGTSRPPQTVAFKQNMTSVTFYLVAANCAASCNGSISFSR